MNETQLNQIQTYAYQQLAQDQSGHGTDHIQRVVALAKKILATEPEANARLVEATALLHDSYDDKLFADQAAAKQNTRDFLTKLGLTDTEIGQIFYIIDNMSWSKGLDDAKPLDLNGQIVQDADRLDAIGAIATTRALAYGFAHDRMLYDPTIAPRDPQSKTAYRDARENTTINHFYEKLLKVKDQLNTQAARDLAESRHQFMVDFLNQFKAEWDLKR
ncbi:HD domain-containing protein [Lactobacillaceae bacterium L1_55_11]|nr:HD domain-containing protein [Lactobacillaceae bacterium L1_55_11]